MVSTLEQNTTTPETSADVRIGRDLLKATVPYAVESTSKSWWLVASTFVLLIAAMCGAGTASKAGTLIKPEN